MRRPRFSVAPGAASGCLCPPWQGSSAARLLTPDPPAGRPGEPALPPSRPRIPSRPSAARLQAEKQPLTAAACCKRCSRLQTAIKFQQCARDEDLDGWAQNAPDRSTGRKAVLPWSGGAAATTAASASAAAAAARSGSRCPAISRSSSASTPRAPPGPAPALQRQFHRNMSQAR
jgi:hypothetical protein